MFSKDRSTNVCYCSCQIFTPKQLWNLSGRYCTSVLYLCLKWQHNWLYQSLFFLWCSMQTYDRFQENVLLVIFFPFFLFPFFPCPLTPLSFLLLLTFLTQSCFLFRNSQAGVNKNFLSFRVHGDYWVPEVHLVPLDNLYVWSVSYLSFLEEKMKVHWKLFVFLLFVAGHCRYWWTFRPKGKHGE